MIPSYPVYIADDDSIFLSNVDIGHTEYWEDEVCLAIARKYLIDYSQLLNRPYCQRRGRIVGEIFYCGEKINNNLLQKINKKYGKKLKLVYDDHEIRNELDYAYFKGLMAKLKA